MRRDGGRADDRAGAGRPRHPRAVDERGVDARGQGDDPRDDGRQDAEALVAARRRRWRPPPRSARWSATTCSGLDAAAAQGPAREARALRRGGRCSLALLTPVGARRRSDARLQDGRDRSLRRSTTASRSTTSRAGSAWSPSARTARCRRRSTTCRPRRRIIVLVDDTDGANGFASVLPRNAIQLYATGPAGFTELDDHDDWLYGLVAHEYTHILHLDTMRGPADHLQLDLRQDLGAEPDHAALDHRGHRGLRGVEALAPAAATAARGSISSSASRATTGQGPAARRGHAARRASFRAATRRYVYGSHFLRYIFDRFGDDTLREMCARVGRVSAAVRDQPPDREGRRQAVHRAVRRLEGLPARSLRHAGDGRRAPRAARSAGALTHTRGVATAGRTTRPTASELYWLQYDGYSLPMVRAMPVGGDVAQAHDVVADRRDRAVRRLSPTARSSTSRAASTAATTRSRTCSGGTRATRADDAAHHRQARARSGGVARRPAGRVLDERALARACSRSMDARARRAGRRSCGEGERYDQAYQPAWSPDGTRIAFSAWRNGGFRDILIVELATGHDRARSRTTARSTCRRRGRADGRYAVLRQRSHRHLEHLRVRHRATARRGRSRTCSVARSTAEAVARRQAARVSRTRSPNGRLRPVRDPARSRDVAARARLRRRQAAADRDPRRRSAGHRRRAPIARSRRSRRRRGRSRSTAARASATHPDRRRRRGRPAQLLARARRRPRHTATRTSARRTPTPGWRPSLRLAASRTLGRARRLADRRRQQDVSAKRTGAATLSLGIPFESRPSSSWTLSFDYDVDWFRLAQAPPYVLDPNMRVADPIRRRTTSRPASRRGSRSRASAATTFGARLAGRLRRERVAAPRSPGARRDVSQRHA